jgi:hypothetical protein
MDLTGLSSVLDFGKALIDRLIPDPQAKLAAQQKLVEMAQQGQLAELAADTDIAKAQAAVNLEEAKSSNIFESGWRPAIGWCCGLIFFSNYVAVPLMAWLSPVIHVPPPPRLDIGEVLPVLLGMLGLGAQRSYDKKQGTAK